MKKLLQITFLSTTMLMFSCAVSSKISYTPFLDLQLLDSIEIGDFDYKIMNTLGEPLIIIKVKSDEQIWKYVYRYRERVALSLEDQQYKIKGGLTGSEKFIYSDDETHQILLHFKDSKVFKISIDDFNDKF